MNPPGRRNLRARIAMCAVSRRSSCRVFADRCRMDVLTLGLTPQSWVGGRRSHGCGGPPYDMPARVRAPDQDRPRRALRRRPTVCRRVESVERLRVRRDRRSHDIRDPRQDRHRAGQPSNGPRSTRARALLCRSCAFMPCQVVTDIFGSVALGFAEDMRMTTDKFAVDVVVDIFDRELACFLARFARAARPEGRDRPVLPRVIAVAVVDGIDDLVRFLDDGVAQRSMRLFAVPGTTIGRRRHAANWCKVAADRLASGPARRAPDARQVVHRLVVEFGGAGSSTMVSRREHRPP